MIALHKRDRLLAETVSKVVELFPVPLWLELIFSTSQRRKVRLGFLVKLWTDAALLHLLISAVQESIRAPFYYLGDMIKKKQDDAKDLCKPLKEHEIRLFELHPGHRPVMRAPCSDFLDLETRLRIRNIILLVG